MGKLKQAYMAKTMDDQGPDMFPDLNLGEDISEPSRSDWAMSELNNAIGTLEKFGAEGYVVELKQYQARIQAVIEKTVKPF